MIVAIDETPVGIFVEIEGSESRHRRDGRGARPQAVRLHQDSYRGLFLQHREEFGIAGQDMVFDESDGGQLTARAPRALLLTAGLGTRLQPLTYVRAKAAVPINGEAARPPRHPRPRDGWYPRSRAQSPSPPGVDRGASSATAAISACRVRYSWEQPVLGSAGGPRHALAARRRLRRRDFLIVNGDTLTDVDIWSLIARHRESSALVTMALIPNPRPSHYGGVRRLSRTGWVTGFTRAQGAGQRTPTLVSLHRRAGRERDARSRRSRTACRRSP